MRTIDASITAQLLAGEIRKREAVKLELGGGTFRYVKDNQPLSWDSQTWADGGVISITAFRRSVGLSASTFSVVLATSSDDDRTPTELVNFYNYDFSDREITCYDFYLDASGAVVAADTIMRGYIDKAKFVNSGQNGKQIALSCYDRSLDFSRRGARMANHQDQLLRDADDKFFEHAAVIGEQTFWWGRQGDKSKGGG